MAKYCHPDNLDAALSAIAAADTMIACSSQPADYAAVAEVNLAEVSMAPADFTLAAGDVSGRKLTVAAKTDVAVGTEGTINHVALVDTANTKLLYVTTSASQAITLGGFVDFPEWDIEIADPS